MTDHCAAPQQTPARAGTSQDSWSYRMFRAFNHPERRKYGGLKCRIDPNCVEYFTGAGLAVRFVHALAERRAVKLKEVLESFEFYARVRRRVRGPRMADLCCGHGLTGVIFAMMEATVSHVTLLDHDHPKNHARVLAAAADVAPWVAGKIQLVSAPVERAAALLAPGTGVVAVHACGVRTDRCLEAAMAVGGPIAMMPCCYHQTDKRVPDGLRRALGRSLSTDIHRTYTLENGGYEVGWTGIPAEITAMNRIMVAVPRSLAG